MKDGKPRLPGPKHNDPAELEALGWFVFVIPLAMLKVIADWTRGNLGGAFIANDVFIGVFSISIRRAEDATLFKLTWPECKPYGEVFNERR